jgi:hypothetical protein
MARRNVTLQVSLAPPDLAHIVHILPHQIRTFGEQVTEVLLVLDRRRSRVARFNAGWEAATPRMLSFLDEIERHHSSVRVVTVDYSRASVRAVARTFFGRSWIPAKDIRGGPFFSYFFALSAASHDVVFHLDSDMLLGGASRSWISEAVELLEGRPEVVAVCPLPGPPTADGQLCGQDAYAPEREGPHSYRFRDFTSRVFLCDRRRLARADGPLPLMREVNRLVQGKSALLGRSSYALPERLISVWMQQNDFVRVDLLGRPPGMWAVHPVDRSERFLTDLPAIVTRVESSFVTPQQLGHYALHPSMMAPAPGVAT